MREKDLYPRESFVFYLSFYNALNNLEGDEKVQFVEAVCRYALFGDISMVDVMDRTVKAVFEVVKPQIDANLKRYIDGCKGAEHGKKGGAPKGNGNARKNNPTGVIDSTPNDNVNDNVNENDSR